MVEREDRAPVGTFYAPGAWQRASRVELVASTFAMALGPNFAEHQACFIQGVSFATRVLAGCSAETTTQEITIDNIHVVDDPTCP